jgi:hypothetical protein
MRPSVPTSHPAWGVAKATAQKPLTFGNVYHVFPSSGVHAGLVDPKIGRIPSNRHQVRNACAETLHIAELQHLGAWHDAGMPSLSTISGDSECAVAPLAQTTCGFTGQTAMRPLVVPLSCGVNVG